MGQEAYSLKYHRLVPRDIAALDAFWHEEILAAIEKRLMTQPDLFGKPLRHTLKGCWTLRVGDYRVVYRIERNTVQILAIIHRSRGYEGVADRV